MRRAPWVATIALLPTVALAACEESATSPANESLALPASAQAAPPTMDAPRLPGPRGPAEILALADELGLTDAQRAAVQEVAERLRALNEPLWEQLRGQGPPRGGPGAGGPPSGGPPSGGPPSGGPGPLGSADDPLIQEIRDNTRAAKEEALSHLTEAQVALFHELRPERVGPAFGGSGPAGHFDPTAAIQALLDELDLTEAQRSRVEAVLREVHERNQGLLAQLRERSGSAGGPGAPGGWDPDDPLVRQLRANLQEGMAAIREILTTEQWERFQALMRERRSQPSGPGSP